MFHEIYRLPAKIGTSIAEKALQAAVRTDSKLKNLQDEKEYTYPSGRVKWKIPLRVGSK